MVIDASGNSYVAGRSVTKFDASGTVIYTKYLGIALAGPVLLDDGSVVVGGATTSPAFPTRDSLQPCTPNLPHDPLPALPNPVLSVSNAVVVRLDAKGNIVHSSLLGFGSPNSIEALALAPNGSLYLAGYTFSSLFPGGPTLLNASAGSYGFAFRLDWQQIRTGLPAPSCMVNSATLVPAPAAPLSVATLFGSNLGPAAGVQYQIGADGRVPTELAGTRVTVGDIPAPILYSQDQQINFIVPGELTGSTTEVCVEAAGNRSCLFAYGAPFAPGIFRIGNGFAVQNQDGSLNTPSNPAARGSFVSIYGTGLGPYVRGVPDGSLAELPLNPLLYTVQASFYNDATCMFGGTICYPGPRETVAGEVLFAGASPLIVIGVTVLNVTIPLGVRPPPWGGGLTLYLSKGGSVAASAELSVAIK